MNEQYLNHFKKMIQHETISSADQSDYTKFYQFHELLKTMFPELFSVCEITEHEGSLLLRWKGTDPTRKAVLFMGHMDVVETSNWTVDPFKGEIIDNKLYGRGTLDNKGDLWGILEAGNKLVKEGFTPVADIYFESSCNEECSGKGATYFANILEKQGVHFAMCFDEGGMIVKNPLPGVNGTFAMIAMGEKGYADLVFTARSNGGHASAPGKDTPLVRLGKFMAEVDNHNPFETQINPVISMMFERLAPYYGKTGILLKNNKALSPLLKKVLPNISPTIGALLSTTLAFTMAEGSKASNVIPSVATVTANMRYSHHQGLEASVDALRPLCKKYDIEMEVTHSSVSSRLTPVTAKAFHAVEETLKEVFPDIDAVPYIMTGASDARFFDKIADETIRFLPFTIDTKQMESIHGIDENIDIDTLEPAIDYYTSLMKRIAS